MTEQGLPQLNYLKTRDDVDIVRFESTGEGKFKLSENSSCSWLNDDTEFGEKELRPRIEPWLTSLFQSEHLSLLAGSGLTHAIHRLATGKSAAGMGTVTFKQFSSEIIFASKVSEEGQTGYQGLLELRRLHVELDTAIRDANGWQDLGNDFHEVETLPEIDRVRYTISPAARKEVLKRLLAENHRRAAKQATSTPAAKSKFKRARKSQANEGQGDLFA